MIINQIAWIFFFLIVAPPGAATMASIIVEEEVFSHPRAWIEAYCWPMFSYMVNCERCIVHWTMALITLLGYGAWDKITFCDSWVVALICWAAATRLAIRFWLRNDT